MSRINSIADFGGFGGIVNGLTSLAALALIASGYISALGSFAGLA